VSARDGSDLLEGSGIRENATRVVRVGDDDDARPWRHRAFHAVWIQCEASGGRALEAIHARTQKPRRGKKRIVSGRLHQHFVAGFEQRGERQEISA
jgi:hypothetical protein